jgi:GH25 family lysozyme M1 (1,4-beta-N-acetylmuramidase)
MKDFGWDANKGIPVTLDVEAGTYAYHPDDTVNYVRAWTRAVKADGYRPYIYTSAEAVNAFAHEHLGIDAVWVASDFYGHFENVSPYGHDLDGQVGHNFDDHNRAWQYAGSAPTVYIPDVGYVDCDVADLELAPKPGGTNL